MTAKTPTPQGISRLLREAGFVRSTSRGGAFGSSSGYIVSSDRARDKAVRVRHHFWSMGATADQHQQKLAEYAEALRSAGWNVDDSGQELIVTAKED